MASQALPPVSVAVTANGSASGGTMSAGPLPPQNVPGSPSSVSPTSSPAFPKQLPPILPAHLPKDVSLSSGLLGTSRPLSPLTRPANEGISPNPAAILKTGGLGMSHASDGPPLTSAVTASAQASGNQATPTEAGAKINHSAPGAQSSEGAATSRGDNQQESLTSPKSVTSVASLDPSLTATSGIGSEASPTRTRTASVSDPPLFPPQQGATQAPGPPFSPTAPGPGPGNDPRGSISSVGGGDPRGSISSVGGSRGKHTCPHCQQTFTRHHNLKSHLLTHSQEKPFQCTSCASRFRRLHDLKRHQKLHTGERPHICNTCGRKFARGDALARHARGEGGCAGRRSSMSALGEEGYEGDGDRMEGLEMSGDGDDDEMPDYEGPAPTQPTGGPGRRTASLPSLRTPRTLSASQQGGRGPPGFQIPPPPPIHMQQPHHTYPPGGHPPQPLPAVSFGPPGPKAAVSISTSSTSIGSGSVTSSTPSTILSHELTASPRPLSPNAPQPGLPEAQAGSSGGRKASASSFHQQAIENRRRSNTGTSSLLPPAASIPPPGQLPQINAGHPGQTSPRDSRDRGPFSNSLASPVAGLVNPPPSGPGNIFSSGADGIWAYIQSMEKRIQELEQKNSVLESRMAAYDAQKQNNTAAEPEKPKV